MANATNAGGVLKRMWMSEYGYSAGLFFLWKIVCCFLIQEKDWWRKRTHTNEGDFVCAVGWLVG